MTISYILKRIYKICTLPLHEWTFFFHTKVVALRVGGFGCKPNSKQYEYHGRKNGHPLILHGNWKSNNRVPFFNLLGLNQIIDILIRGISQKKDSCVCIQVTLNIPLGASRSVSLWAYRNSGSHQLNSIITLLFLFFISFHFCDRKNIRCSKVSEP